MTSLLPWSVHARPFWAVPIFLDLPTGWRAQPADSPDSRAFVVSKGRQVILFDYLPSSAQQTLCRATDVAQAKRLSDLPCVVQGQGERQEKMSLYIADPAEKSFQLRVFTKTTHLADPTLHQLLRSLRFVGAGPALTLLATEHSAGRAKVVDETGIPRWVKLGEVVTRQYGMVRQIGNRTVLIEETILDAAGDYQLQTWLLRQQ
ncbi:hypothetical protein [Chitinimonas lacunae]|uniref:Uncharacterized protein n=1 Tax=Chitinimonas lacunae TaxID=1963018 RepID=A0ABV8MPR1_9NEIS